MDPSIAAEQLIAAEIAGLVGTDPEHEPNEARLPGGVADFRFSVEALGAGQRHILVEVKSLHDHAGQSRPSLIDYELRHPDVPNEWSARDEWSAAGEQRIRRLGMLPEQAATQQLQSSSTVGAWIAPARRAPRRKLAMRQRSRRG